MKIGLLLPTSKMYPSLAMDFTSGIRLAIKKAGYENEIQLVLENIGNGTNKERIISALNKLVIQEQTDINILFINSILLTEVTETAKALKRPLIITNIGANIPADFYGDDYLLMNSFNLWESAYMAAKWGVENKGKKLAHGSYYYEAGYQLYECFSQGLLDSGGNTVLNQVSQLNPDPNDFELFMENIEPLSPDFLYMLYSERDAVSFLNKLSASGYNGKYPIVTSGVMINDEILEQVHGTPQKIVNISSWDPVLDKPENKIFAEEFQNETENKPNFFSLLAYECGGAICDAMKSKNWSQKGLDQFEAVKASSFTGPRGILEFNNDLNMTQFHNYVFELKENRTRKMYGEVGKMNQRSELIMMKRQQDRLAGWFQAYLCQ